MAQYYHSEGEMSNGSMTGKATWTICTTPDCENDVVNDGGLFEPKCTPCRVERVRDITVMERLLRLRTCCHCESGGALMAKAEYRVPEQIITEFSTVFTVSESTYTEIMDALAECGMQDRFCVDGDFDAENPREWLLNLRDVVLRKHVAQPPTPEQKAIDAETARTLKAIGARRRAGVR